nr:reverse transcriptase domain-containing protein [Tanacetum cinerariifolium]
MVNVIPPDHVDDLPDLALAILEPALVDENEKSEEEEFKDEKDFEEEEPQKEEDDMEVKDTVEPEDETVPASVHEVVQGGATGMENLVKKLGNDKEKADCKKLKKELEEARSNNTLLCIQKERVKGDPYWTRVQAYKFYQEMIRKGVMFKERPNEAIDVPIEDEKSLPSKLWGSPHRARRANVSGAGGSRQDGTPAARKCTFARFMKCNPTVFYGTEGAIELRRWFKKTESVFRISECAEG